MASSAVSSVMGKPLSDGSVVFLFFGEFAEREAEDAAEGAAKSDGAGPSGARQNAERNSERQARGVRQTVGEPAAARSRGLMTPSKLVLQPRKSRARRSIHRVTPHRAKSCATAGKLSKKERERALQARRPGQAPVLRGKFLLPNPLVNDVEIDGAIGRVIAGCVHGLYQEGIGAGIQVLHFDDQPDGNHRIALLNEFVEANRAGREQVLVRGAIQDVVASGNDGRLVGSQQGFIDLGVEDDVIGFLEAIRTGGHDLHAFDHQRGVIFEQLGIHTGVAFRDALRRIGNGHASQAEMLAVVGVDLQRRLELSVGIAAAIQDHGEAVFSRGGIELIFIVVGRFLERFQFVLFEFEIDRIAEFRADAAIGPVRDSKDVDVRAILAFFLLEFQRFGRNLHREVDARDIRRGIEIGRLQRAVDRAGIGRSRASFELLLDGFALERVFALGVAVAAARADVNASPADLDLQRVAASLGAFGRGVAQDIEFALFPSNLGQTAEQIVGIEDRKAAGAFGERGKDLLVGAYRRRKLWNDGAGLGKDVIRVGVVWIEAAGSRAGAARAARGTAAGSAGAARAACAAGSAGAAPATSCPTAACSATAAANGPAAASYRRSSPAAGPLRIGRKNK